MCARMCKTCIFRPGNLMDLAPGRVEGMISSAEAAGAVIPCHRTTHGQDARGEAVCRGFFELHSVVGLRLAEAMNVIEWQEPPEL